MSEFSRRLSGMDGFRQQRIKEYLIRKARNEGLSSLSRLDRLWQETMQEMGFLPTIQGVTVKVR
jgi:hypothetical protein